MNNHKAKIGFLMSMTIAALVGLSACTSGGEGTKEAAAGGPTEGGSSKGIGPVAEVKLAALDVAVADEGKAIFTAKCSACHKIGERFVGPDLKGVTKRRQPEWIMNMVLNPAEMTQKDATAKELLGEYLTQMTFQNVTQDEVRKILEHFRREDAK